MGFEPTTFCMASSCSRLQRAPKSLQICGFLRMSATIRRALDRAPPDRASELRALAITRGDTRAVRGAPRQRRRSSKIAELPAAGTGATRLAE
jgi:hypothetical protein